MDKERLDNLYSNLSKINAWNNCKLIVTGDHLKILNHDSTQNLFLQKVIGRVVALPKSYSSQNIWQSIIVKYLDRLKIDLLDSEIENINYIRDSFIFNKRTTREAIQFIELININRDKLLNNKVNIGEFLILCYFYQFYLPLYLWIIEDPFRFLQSYTTVDEQEKELKSSKFDFLVLSKSVIETESQLEKIEKSHSLLELINRLKMNHSGKTRTVRFNYDSSLYHINDSYDYTPLTINTLNLLLDNSNSSKEIFNSIFKNDQITDLQHLLNENLLIRPGLFTTQDIEKLANFVKGFIVANKNNNRQLPINNLSINLKYVFDAIKSSMYYESIDKYQYNEFINNTIILNEHLDVSQKIFIYNIVSLESDNCDDYIQFLLKKDFDITHQEYPKIIYKAYFKNIMIDEVPSVEYEKIFALNENDFLDFVNLAFVDYVFEREKYIINLKEIFNNNTDFINRLNKKIDTLSEPNKNKLNSYIENYYDIYGTK